MPRDEQCEHVALAGSECDEPRAHLIVLPQGGAIAGVVIESIAHADQQYLVGNGLLKKVERAVQHGFDGSRDPGMTADEDHGNDLAPQIELMLQFWTGHSGHLYIKQQATRLVWFVNVATPPGIYALAPPHALPI